MMVTHGMLHWNFDVWDQTCWRRKCRDEIFITL